MDLFVDSSRFLTNLRYLIFIKFLFSSSKVEHTEGDNDANIDVNMSEHEKYIKTTSTPVLSEQKCNKKPTPVSLFKLKDPPKRKYRRKPKASGRMDMVNGTAHPNYDSDSIDLDLLASYNAKTFHTAAYGHNVITNTFALGMYL